MAFPDRRWFRLLARLYPASFRRRYGRDMERAYLRLLAIEAERRPRTGAWWARLRTLGDALIRGTRLRITGGEAGAARESTRGTRDEREGRTTMGMDRWIQDVRYAARSLRRQPLFLGAAVATLGIGIGATTAVFSVVHGVLLQPLPVEEPERLVRVYLEEPGSPGGTEYLTAMDARLVREQDDVFDDVAVFYDYDEEGADLTGGVRPERVRTLPVSSGYFRLLGVELLLGREFAPEEERDSARVAVVSHGLWTRYLGGSGGGLGSTLRLDDVAYTVIGVLPPDFRDPLASGVEVYVPQDLDPASSWNNWDNHYVSAVGRLAEGVGPESAGERLRAAAMPANRLNRGDPEDFWLPRLVPLRDDLVGRAETLLWVLLGAVALVLLLACANVANLSLARGVGRARELAVRSALGAGRARLVRQLLAESVLVALAGGLVGAGLASAALAAFRTLPAGPLPRAEEVAVDLPVLAFTLLVTVTTAFVFGLLPALRHARSDPGEDLRQGARGSSRRSYGLRRGLVAVQMALATVLLVGAGLLARSFLALQDVELGLDPEGVLVYDVHLPEARYGDASARMEFYRELHERVEAVPGVEAAGSIQWLPVRGTGYRWGAWNVDAPEGTEPTGVQVRIVDGDYFEAMGIGLVRGRALEPGDRADAPLVALVSRRTAERLFPDADPVGAGIRVGGREWRVVGVVEDVATDVSGDVQPTAYLPHGQFADRHWALHQVVSVSGDPGSLVAPLRNILGRLDPALVLHRPRPLRAVLGEGLTRQRLAAAVMGAFAALALGLAVVGIYGVLAFLVGRRSHEIGIRMALGAGAAQVRRMVARESLVVAATGIGVGVLGAVAFSRWLRTLVFEVEVTDPGVYGAVAAGLLAVALLAAWIPARRAAAVDPARAFRSE